MPGMKKKATTHKNKKDAKRKMNDFMVMMHDARKANIEFFVYKGNTYYKKLLPTGLVYYAM